MAQTIKGTGRRIKNQGSNWIRKGARCAIYLRDGFACVYCGAKHDDGKGLTLDHIVACEVGGKNRADNLVTACTSCNSAKQAKSMRAFMRYLRAQGTDTTDIPARVRRAVARKVNRTAGNALAMAWYGRK